MSERRLTKTLAEVIQDHLAVGTHYKVGKRITRVADWFPREQGHSFTLRTPDGKEKFKVLVLEDTQ